MIMTGWRLWSEGCFDKLGLMNKVEKFLFALCYVLFANCFLPIVTEHGFGRQWVMMGLGLVGMLLWMVRRAVEKKKNSFRVNGWWWWLLVLIGWAIVSLMRMQPGLEWGDDYAYFGMVSLLGMGVWTFLWMQQDDEEIGGNELFDSGWNIGGVDFFGVVFWFQTRSCPYLGQKIIQ